MTSCAVCVVLVGRSVEEPAPEEETVWEPWNGTSGFKKDCVISVSCRGENTLTEEKINEKNA